MLLVKNQSSLMLSVVVAFGLAGCNDSSSGSNSPSVDAQLADVISAQGLTGDPSLNRTLPAVTDPEAQLGMELFFSKALGGDQDAACVTCHHPALGGGDDLSLSIGVGADHPDLLGPGRTHAGSELPNVPRNAPTTFNIALWDSVLFLDGRVESMTKLPGQNGADGQIRTPDSLYGELDPLAGLSLTIAQSRFPVTSVEEMRGETFEAGNGNEDVRTHLAARLANAGIGAGELAILDNDVSGFEDWPERFEEVFGDDDITYARIATAIAAYEASQVFVDNPWKDYVQGDTSALTDSQKRGALLFYTPAEEGGADCAACHGGDFFTDEESYNIAMVQIGAGKGDGDDGTDDFGRYRETGDEMHKYAFRTPTLLNVAETQPFGHAGAYDTLEGVIRHHLNPQNAIADYFASSVTWCHSMAQFQSVQNCDTLYPSAEFNTVKALATLQIDQKNGRSELTNVDLSDSQVADLVAFMEALTDPCLKDSGCLAQWIPDTSTTGASGLQLNAVDRNSQPLVAN
jgi:cytochrome c peroxidase